MSGPGHGSGSAPVGRGGVREGSNHWTHPFAAALASLGNPSGVEVLRATCADPLEESQWRIKSAILLLHADDEACFDPVLDVIQSQSRSSCRETGSLLIPGFSRAAR
jgi:hypothetical protein